MISENTLRPGYRVLFLVLICLFVNLTGKAQAPNDVWTQRLTYGMYNSNWRLSNRTFVIRDSQSRIVEERTQFLPNFQDTLRVLTQYDASGEWVEQRTQLHQLGTWVDSVKKVRAFNAQADRTLFARLKWNGMSWDTTELRRSYWSYNGANLPTEQLIYGLDNQGNYRLEVKFEYAYTNNVLSQETESYWNGNTWDPYEQRDFLVWHDYSQRQKAELIIRDYEESSSTWIPKIKKTWSWGSNGSNIQRYYNFTNGVWDLAAVNWSVNDFTGRPVREDSYTNYAIGTDTSWSFLLGLHYENSYNSNNEIDSITRSDAANDTMTWYNRIKWVYSNTPLEIGEPTHLPLVATVYPNPFAEQLFVECSLEKGEELLFKVYDLHGRFVLREAGRMGKGTAQWSFDTQSWPAGIYIYQLWVGDRSQSGKLIRQ